MQVRSVYEHDSKYSYQSSWDTYLGIIIFEHIYKGQPNQCLDTLSGKCDVQHTCMLLQGVLFFILIGLFYCLRRHLETVIL